MLRCLRIPYSTNVERVALAAAHKGLRIEWIDVPEDDRSEVERISGQPLVPVLLDGGEVVADSTAILRHLEERYGGAPLWPSTPARRAELDVFLDWFNLVWKRPPNALADELSRERPDQAVVDAESRALRGSLDRFEALLDGRAFLLGELGAADFAAFPFLEYGLLGLPPGDEELFHRVLAEHLRLGDAYPRLAEWVRRIDALPRA